MSSIQPAPQQGSTLFQTERQRQIASLTLQEGRVEVAELSDRFNVTTETIRRDLSHLQRQQLLRRVHGGAVPMDHHGFEPLVAVRIDQHDSEKRRIARLAVREITRDSAVMIDSGSTLTRLAEVLPVDMNLRVVTNSLITAQVLADKEGVNVLVLGGEVRRNTLAMVDADTVASVRPLTVDTLFISSDAASANGLTTPYSEEAALKRAMITSARRVIALVDHFKFVEDHFIRFAEWSDIDLLITNSDLDPKVVRQVEAAGTSVALA